jgi:hypothetical protein
MVGECSIRDGSALRLAWSPPDGDSPTMPIYVKTLTGETVTLMVLLTIV